MQSLPSRRQFLADVGRGMLAAGVGWHAAVDMGFMPRAWANAPESRLNFGEHEALVDLMQQTPAEKLLPLLVRRIEEGTSLKTLLTAGVLANSRSFGGEDYIGFHTLMALGPALAMSRQLSPEKQALPILKVLYRNTSRIQAMGGASHEILQPVVALADSAQVTPFHLHEACRQLDKAQAEQVLSTLAQQDVNAAFNALLLAVADETEVHRVNLAYRAYDLLGTVGPEHAVTLLRQSARYCINIEQRQKPTPTRQVLAKMFDQFRLDGISSGTRFPDDSWIESTASAFYRRTPEQAAEIAAAALAEGIVPDAIAQAAALAANQLVLRDPGRPEKWSDAKKPAGSVHGDSVGVHACDAVNAWRNIAQVSNTRNQIAAVILAAYEVSRDHQMPNWGDQGTPFSDKPTVKDLDSYRSSEPVRLLAEAEAAIRRNDQAGAAAAVYWYGETGASEQPVFDLLLKYAISEDGALHAEKFYQTVCHEFTTQRPAFRWRQLTALARVTASEYGYSAPGYAEACELLHVPS